MGQTTQEPKYRFLACNHCGNLGNIKVLTRYIRRIEDDEMGAQYFTTWDFLLCPACGKAILVEDHEEFPGSPYDEDNRTTVLYPPYTKKNLTHIPPSIQKEYNEALRTQKISLNGCAMLARRTLEAICVYEKATGKDLFEKIKNLLQTNRIPPLFSDLAHLSRKIGNLQR